MALLGRGVCSVHPPDLLPSFEPRPYDTRPSGEVDIGAGVIPAAGRDLARGGGIWSGRGLAGGEVLPDRRRGSRRDERGLPAARPPGGSHFAEAPPPLRLPRGSERASREAPRQRDPRRRRERCGHHQPSIRAGAAARKTFGLLEDYESKRGCLPEAAFYPGDPLSGPDSLRVLLAAPDPSVFACSTCGPELRRFGLNYAWNRKASGRGTLALQGERVTRSAEGKKAATALAAAEAVRSAIEAGDWNDYTIIAPGNRLIHRLNGTTTMEFTDEEVAKRARTRVLVLQLHAGAPMTARFRSIRLRELSAE